MDLGDRAEDSTIDFKFSTRNVSAAPAALAGTPVLSVYKANGTTGSTAGITLITSFDGKAALNQVRIITTDAFYSAGDDYEVVITTGTVNSVSVVGTVVATFSIENRFMRGTNGANTVVPDAAGVAPTAVENRQEMDSNSVDLNSLLGGQATISGQITGLNDFDPANDDVALVTLVTLVTTTTALTNVINASSVVASVAGNVGGNVVGSVGSVTGNVDGNVTGSVANVIADVGITQVGADKAWTTTTRALTDKVGFALSTAGILAIWNQLTGALTTASTIGKLLVDNINATISSRAQATDIVSGGAINTTAGAVDNVTTVATLTGNTPQTGDNFARLGAPAGASVSADNAAIKLDTGTNLPAIISSISVKKNTAFPNFTFLMVLTSDHVTPATGLTVTGQRRLDNGSFVPVSGTITEVAFGYYEFDGLAADTNGDIGIWLFSSATADDTGVTFKTIP